MNDEELAEQTLKEQADMLNRAFGLEKEEYKIPDYDMCGRLTWKEAVAIVDDLPVHGEEGETRYVEEGGKVYVFTAEHGWVAVERAGAEETWEETDITWWRDRIAKGLGVDPEELEVTHNPIGSIDSSIVQTVEEIDPRRVFTREDFEREYEEIVSQPIASPTRGQSHLAEAMSGFFKWHMNKPSLLRRILPPVEEE